MANFNSATGGGSTASASNITQIGSVAIPVMNTAFGTTTPLMPIGGKYMATPTTYDDGDAVPFLTDSEGRIVLSSDIQIGTVELKDSSTDLRASITAADGLRTIASNVLLTQNVDKDGNVLTVDRADTARTTSTLVLPVQQVGVNGIPFTMYAEDAAHVSGNYGVLSLGVRRDTAASSSGTDGDNSTLGLDSLGHVWTREGYAPTAEDNPNGIIAMTPKPLAVSTYTYTLFTNFGANATLNVKAAAGNVFSCKCHNLNAADRYLQLHNTATVPAGSGVPLMTFLIPAGAERIIGTDLFGVSGMNFATGIAFAFSTTEGTYTAGTAGDQFTQIEYK
jgi:hypothetical protein